MKIKLLFLLIYFNIFSEVLGNCPEADFYSNMIDNIMIMWTKIDTVRAINTDFSQKNIFLEDLINDSLKVYCLASYGKQISNASIENNENLVHLVDSINQAFEEVFVSVKNPDCYVFCKVLQKVISILKTPQSIKSEISS